MRLIQLLLSLNGGHGSSGIDESEVTVEIRKDKWDDFTFRKCTIVAQHINQYFSIDLLLQYRLTKLQSNHRRRSRGPGGTGPPMTGFVGTD